MQKVWRWNATETFMDFAKIIQTEMIYIEWKSIKKKEVAPSSGEWIMSHHLILLPTFFNPYEGFFWNSHPTHSHTTNYIEKVFLENYKTTLLVLFPSFIDVF